MIIQFGSHEELNAYVAQRIRDAAAALTHHYSANPDEAGNERRIVNNTVIGLARFLGEKDQR